ncbi:winged helix-turn-helix transcriptional regulator [Mobilitalea sibirica]|uniref:Winged helix-turn-helix transcriptional regulator n=1 Tax=Mobilitalea sibirica TaxID=1462919 RepID=A0A8J7H3U1_9FIRM|nr:metalloregulator ArsR/SmtB family transcription factor [Mobilitalea sibirica]MBH1941893.1 winged helix-turn-helix transcriptional regulator [Mobilitalea sibirica]
MQEKFYKQAMLFKAMADANRLLILEYLMDGERCACKILEQLPISQPTLSHHMKILCDCDLVSARKDGKWMHYSINNATFIQLNELLEGYLQKRDTKDDCAI